MVGVIVAETQLQAQEASWKVDVKCEKLPVILTIEEAIEADSFIGSERKLIRGDVDEGFSLCDHIIEGIFLV